MKIIVSVFLIAYISLFPSTQKPKSDDSSPLAASWWRIALVDAGGALGGAGSVASLCPGCAAVPIGQVAIGLGAVVGGASASVGYAGRAISSGGNINPVFTQNEYDHVGLNHNRIIAEYLSQYAEVDPRTFYSFIQANKDNYGGGEIYLNEEFVAAQMAKAKQLRTIEDIYAFIIENLPLSVNRNAFIGNLSAISESVSKEEFINRTKTFENAFFREETLSPHEEISMKSFFSTLRYSAILW